MMISKKCRVAVAVCAACWVGVGSVAWASDPYKVTAEAFSDTGSLNDLSNMTMGESLMWKENFTSGFNYGLSGAHHSNGRYSYGGSVGYGWAIKSFSPYVDLSLNSNPVGTQSTRSTYVGYDVGVGYALTHRVSASVELDNIDVHKRDALGLGTTYAVTPKISLGADVKKNLAVSGSGFDVKMAYAF
jgi:hypothetical protein